MIEPVAHPGQRLLFDALRMRGPTGNAIAVEPRQERTAISSLPADTSCFLKCCAMAGTGVGFGLGSQTAFYDHPTSPSGR